MPTEAIGIKATGDGRFIVCEGEDLEWLKARGYGVRIDDDCIELRPYEALYLVTQGVGAVADEEGREMTEREMTEIGLRRSRRFWTKYLVYRDLRSRGYVVREGYGIGTDLRVYDRGDYGKKEARYLVIAFNEGLEVRARRFLEYFRRAKRLNKEPVLAVVERRGDVVYYKISGLQRGPKD